MTEQEKQLLLIDLCARLPYKIMGHVTWNYKETNGEIKYAEKDRSIEINDLYDIWNFKPYLRPMSSMTEDEREEYRKLGGVMSYNPERETWAMCAFTPEAYDWLNKKMFDYRGLIEKGLALESSKGMYNIETE